MAATSILVAALSALMFAASHAGEVAIYWGQYSNEGTLREACETRNYGIVIIAFLNQFGKGQNPQLNLAGHCDPNSGGCVSLSDEIHYCQSINIKVFLSLGGGLSSYSLNNRDDVKSLAEHIRDNYLSGHSDSRPLGDAVLDGVDFDIEHGSHDFYDKLAKRLRSYSTDQRRVLLSAAPQCPFPDKMLKKVIKVGLDYVWVQFYNNPPCQYSEGQTNPADNLDKSWGNEWAPNIKGARMFIGLPAARDAAGSGFIPENELISNVLPRIKASNNYAGVMLWSRFHDVQTGYSAKIKPHV